MSYYRSHNGPGQTLSHWAESGRDAMTRAAAAGRRAASDFDDVDAARGLGVVSILIGLTELLFPRQLDRAMGTGNGRHTGLLRVLGIRELMHGVDLLAHRDPTPGIRARVAGDMLDGMLLGCAATQTRRPDGLAAVFALVLPVVLADLFLAKRLNNR